MSISSTLISCFAVFPKLHKETIRKANTTKHRFWDVHILQPQTSF